MNTREFDEMIRKLEPTDSTGDFVVVMHPKYWNGYWSVYKTIPFFRWLGHKLHSKRIYWIGFQIEWVRGLKEYAEVSNV